MTATMINEQIIGARVAIEAFHDDVMEPDKQQFNITNSIDKDMLHIEWSWRCYHNFKQFKLDENLETNVKAYLFDLIIATRNL